MSEERKSICCAGSASWALIVSIALNLFLVGVLAAPILGPKPGPDFGPNFGPDRRGVPMMRDGRMGGPGRADMEKGPRKDHGPTFIFEKLASELPEAEAKKLHAIIDAERSEIGKSRNVMHETMTKVADILASEKPDLEALKKVLDVLHVSGKAMHERMSKTMTRFATELSLESRQKIAEHLKMPFPGKREFKGKRDFKDRRDDRSGQKGPQKGPRGDHMRRGGPEARPDMPQPPEGEKGSDLM